MEEMQRVALENYGSSLWRSEDFEKETDVITIKKRNGEGRRTYEMFARQSIEEIGAHEFVSLEISERMGAFHFIEGDQEVEFQPKGLSDLNTSPNETEDAMIALLDLKRRAERMFGNR